MAKTTKITKVAQFNRDNVKAVIAECEAALRPIAEKYGLALLRKNFTYRTDELPLSSFKMMTVAEGVDASADPKDAILAGAFVKYAATCGLQPHWLGKSFDTTRWGRLAIIGLAPKSRRFPVIVEDASGKRFKLEESTVIAGMAPNEAAKVAPGTKVKFKHEDEINGKAAGPVWLEDPTRPAARIRLEVAPGGTMQEVEEDPAAFGGKTKTGRLIGWAGRDLARRYAQTIGASFVEV